MKSLPSDLASYKRTPTFNSETVPVALLRDHSTKAGVWGLIHVVTGKVIYRISEPDEVHRLAPGTLGMVEAEVPHSVKLTGGTEFFVEFWKAEGT